MSVTDWGQFEESTLHEECAVWEAMCPDAVDGTLTEAEQRAFDKHVAGCMHCAEELEQAQRGAAWLHMLKGHTPEPPADLMARILAETTGAAPAAEPAPVFVPAQAEDMWSRPRVPVAQPSRWGALWARVSDTFRVETASSNFQPRFAMTAAMAFFSLALSLNLMGIRLRDVGHISLRPGSLSRTVADASASAERKFQNMRVVYQLESRVSELRNDESPADRLQDDRQLQPQPAAQPNQGDGEPQQPQPDRPHGSSELILPPAAAAEKGQAAPRGEA